MGERNIMKKGLAIILSSFLFFLPCFAQQKVQSVRGGQTVGDDGGVEEIKKI
jgi:hypothetical protein